MSILDIKTNLSEAFGKTGYSKSKPFESINPPKHGQYPELLPTEIKELFDIGNPLYGDFTPGVSIDKQQTKFKISDFSVGDIIHTQPYISQEIRRKVTFPATQIQDHILRIGKFLDSPEGSLFIANQAMLQAFNVMPKSFAGLTASDGVYKIYNRSDNTRFSPVGIRGSSIPGFHIERHKITRSRKEEAYGRFAIDIGGTRSSYLTANFPNLAPNMYRMDIEAVEGKAKSVFEIIGSGFAKRMQPAFENQLMSIVEQEFTNPRTMSIKKFKAEFKSLAAESIGGAFGDLLGAGAKSLTEKGVDAISDLFGGFNSNLNFGKGKWAKAASAVVNTGANIIADTISTVAQKTFAEQVLLQTTKAGIYVGKRLGIDPKFVTNSIQAAFSKHSVVVSQVSPTNKLNKYNILAPYYEASHHTDGAVVSIHVLKHTQSLSQTDFIRAGYGRDPESRKLGMEGFFHISRVSLIDEKAANIIAKNPDTIYRNEDVLGHAGAHRQISYRVLPYSLLKTDSTGLGEWHPAKLAGATSAIEFLKKEKAETLGKYSEGRGNDGLYGYRKDTTFGVMKPSSKSDQVTLHRPKKDNNELVDDFVHFVFHDVVNKKHIQFRAVLGAITDTIRPEWESIKYLGRADQVYIYKGVIRNVNFTFKFAAFTKQELIFGWEKLNYLVGLAYPSKYQEGGIGKGQMVAPLIKLTIGGIFDQCSGLINNISLTVPDQSPWDINPDLELPKYVEASIDFQYIGDNKLQTQSKHYGLPFMKPDGSLSAEAQVTIGDTEKYNQSHNEGGTGRYSGRINTQNVTNADKFKSYRTRLLGNG